MVGAYGANLEATLRGFRPADEMLDTWVPDEDPVRGLSSLVEAAQLGGSDSISVRVAKSTIEHLNLPSLTEKLGTMGEVVTEAEADSVVFKVTNLQETASFRSVRPLYQQKLRARSGHLNFKRALKVAGNQIPLRATEDQFSLAWAVQPDKYEICDAAFDTAARGPMLAALDCLCELLIGLPVQEAREHAVIRLEFALRDASGRPVPGIVLPRNADPIFRVPSILVNRLFEDYRTSTNYQPVTNFFDPGPKPAWAALPHTERAQRVEAVIAANAPALGFQNGEVHVVECKRPYAVTIQFNGGLTIPAKRSIALRLERLVRKDCDPRLEVFCEEKKDLSKLRRTIEHIEKEKAES